MQYLKQHCPESSCVYLADSAHFPYGTKTPEQVIQSASECISLIIRKWNPQAIIIACNTISVTALGVLRRLYPQVPIVGTVPAIKLAAKLSQKRVIGLLATQGAVQHPYVQQLKDDFASDCRLVMRGDTDLVSFVEHKFFTSTKEERLLAVRPAVDFFTEQGCDAIVLGCTHFVHLVSEFEEAAGQGIHIVDSREGVVRQALTVVRKNTGSVQNGILSAAADFLQEKPADQALYTTGFKNTADVAEYRALCKRLSIPWGGVLSD